MNGHNAATVTKLALLIDGDNMSAAYMPLIMSEAGKYGVIAVRRIYGQFKSGKMKAWQKHVDEFDLTTVNVSPLTRGKNATDMKLVIEAMDMLHGRQLDGLCIASSDGDFAPLVARIRATALAVYGFGAKKAPAAYKEQFDRFFECDTLLAAKKAAASSKATPRAKRPAARAPARSTEKPAAKPKASPTTPQPQEKKASKATTAKEAIPDAAIIAALAKSKSGWTLLSTLGHLLKREIPDFTPKRYGYRSMTDLIGAVPGVESRTESGNRYVRRKSP